MLEFVDGLEQEQASLEELLRSLATETWRAATPAAGWDVRDQVAHLADTEEIALGTASGGERQLNEEALKFSTPEEFTLSGCIKGRAMEPADALEWWIQGAARTREHLRTLHPKQRIPWGLGMSARSFVTARLMETWAHGLDIRAAAGEQPNITERLKDIAWLITNAVPYAFMAAKQTKPEGTLKVELTAANGQTWSFGPGDATDSIAGDAAEYCRVGVQRLKLADAPTLKASGPLAEQALSVLRAFL